MSLTLLADPELMVSLSHFIHELTGLYYPQQSWPQLANAIAVAARERPGGMGTKALAQWLIEESTPEDATELLARYLTIGETYFFREPASLHAFEHQMLPELIAARRNGDRRLRIWSAACCTGEEPYTLAMIVRSALPDWRDWNITILATDINRDFLARAREGVYRDWSFRAMPPGKRDAYFTRTENGSYAINDEIKEMVQFSYLNLSSSDYPALFTNTDAMDVIFCRNVLMYLSPAVASHVAARFLQSLGEGGWLVVNPSEASSQLFWQYQLVLQPGAILFRKPRVEVPQAVRPGTGPLPQRPIRPLGRPSLADRSADLSSASRIDRAKIHIPKVIQTTEKEAIKVLVPTKADEIEIYIEKARNAADAGKLDEALKWCLKAIAADKVQPRLHYLHATILMEQALFDDAQAALRRVLFLDQRFVPAYLASSNLALRVGNSNGALKHLQAARSSLAAYSDEEIVPESGGMTAGRMTRLADEMIAGIERNKAR